MTDRELMQDALDALTYVGDKDIYSDTIDALRARLAQPENDFNPDWDAMAVMVEEQQRMAKRIEELEARLSQPEPAQCDGGQCGIGGYCKQCPKTKSDVPETAFGETKPVLYQVRGRPNWDTEPKWGEWKFCTEPVANDYKKTPVLHDWEYQVRSLYTTPPQREWQGLTDEEYEAMAEQYVTNCYFDTLEYAKAIEAKLKEKNT